MLLGLRHPDSVFAPSTWHALAGHCEQESAITCLIRESREEAGLHIEPRTSSSSTSSTTSTMPGTGPA
ncbi:NUDIX domain-containing protein [Streptomyces massasporeus]|uniref:NUDIX domain-containing protein n=1 Tax=Streptomyces massasporeus TaxID=67324 RepID=UPI00381A3ABA